MKNKKRIDLFSLADDKYISEADPKRPRMAKRRFSWTTFLAAACCFLLILNIAVIIPVSLTGDGQGLFSPSQGSSGLSTGSDLNHIKNPQSGSDTTDSSYGNPDEETGGLGTVQFVKNPDLISALDKYLNRNQGANADNELQDSLEEELDQEKEEMEDLSGSLKPDINDNQVQGVSEADIAKRSDKFLYYLRGEKLYIYSLKGEDSGTECIFPLTTYTSQMNSYMKSVQEKEDSKFDKIEELYRGTRVREMFLSEDFKTLTVIMTNSYCNMTGIFVFDVSDSPAVTLKSFHMMSGSYVSSRMVNGELLLFTRYYVSYSYNEDEPSTYVPFYVYKNKEYFTNDIYFPSSLNSNSYLTVTRLSHHGAIVEKSLSYLSFDDILYVSQNNVFITRQLPLTSGKFNTEIVGIEYSGSTLSHKGAVTVKGHLNNQYSLDEHGGILRVATTTYFGEYSEISKTAGRNLIDENTDDEMDEIIIDDLISSTGNGDTSASLYCIDLSSWKIRASVENFAPKGEVVRSVRFEGTNAYVCTSLQQVFVDPVFFFDLSDLDNITYTETGEFDGYSSSLINFGDGYVVGIGYGSITSTLKIDVYKEKGEEVEIVCSDIFEWTQCSQSYKSYFIDRERHLIGIGITSRRDSKSAYVDYYLLLHFNGSFFDFVLSEKVSHSSLDSVRSFLMGEYVYVVTDTEFKVFKTGTLDNLPFTPEENIGEAV